MTKPIRVQLTKAVGDWPKGAELGFDSETDASKSLGHGAYKITANADTTEYVAPARPTDGPPTETTADTKTTKGE